MKIVLAFIFLLGICACNSAGNEMSLKANKNDSADKIAVFQSDDDGMNKAIAKARSSYPNFLNVLKSGCNNCVRFNVKIRLAIDEINGEHVWLDSLFFKQDRLYGILASVPESVNRVTYGDILEAKSDSLSDWMYVEKGKLVGGYTIKAVYNRMSGAEKKQLEQELGATVTQ
jgi:uncharacterized protein YegJ (DUF2314 family)